jgi:ribonuclease I
MKSQVKILILITLSLLSIISSKKELEFLKEKNLNTPSDFQSYTYSIQWGNTICVPSTQCREHTKEYKKNVITIHGLWPNGENGKQLPTCNSDSLINFEINDDVLQQNMNIHWLSLSGPNKSFWEHEYNKHGYCYAYKYNVSQTEFFGKAMDLYLKYNFENLLSELMQNPAEEKVEISEEDLRAIVDKQHPELEYDIDCKVKDHENYLAEIRIYFNLEFRPYSPQEARQITCLKDKKIILQKM